MKIFWIFYPEKKKNTEWSLKCACHSAAFSGTECPLKGHWTVPEIRISVNIPRAFSGHSEMFQLTERRIFILCMCMCEACKEACDVYKWCCSIGKIVPPKKINNLKCRLSCKTLPRSIKNIFEFIQSSSTFHKVKSVFNKFITWLYPCDIDN